MHLSRAKKMAVRGCKIRTAGRMGKNSPHNCCNCLPCAQTSVGSGTVMLEEDLAHLHVWPYPTNSLLTSLTSAHIALHWLWHLSPRIPLTRLLHCPRHNTVAGWPMWSLSPSFSLLLKWQTCHSLPTIYVHNIHHLALLLCSTHVTEWSTNNPGAAGHCRYLVDKARNSNWHHIKKKRSLLSYQPSYVTKLAYRICGVLSNLWGSGQEYFCKNHNWSRQTMYTELVQCCTSINSSALLTHWRGQ